MTVIDDTIKEVIDANKDRSFKKNTQVTRIELGEVMYKFEELFDTPKQALDRTKQGDEPKFTVLEKKVQQVNIKPTTELNIERGKDNVQSKKDIATQKSATTGKSTNE